MKSISLDITKAQQFLPAGAVMALKDKAMAARKGLEDGTVPGNDFLGWLHLPSSITPEFLAEVKAVAAELREKAQVIVVAGIGGSYLGAKCVIEGLSNSFQWLVKDDKTPAVVFAGNNIGEDYLYELTSYLKGKTFAIINISKSGTTTETALTFRLLKTQLEAQVGKDKAKELIVAVTDAKKGAARTCADKEGYRSFIIPDNVGGRFSVLTPVGLLPIAAAGCDIDALMQGAASMRESLLADPSKAKEYAVARQNLYAAGKMIEIFASYDTDLRMIGEWNKQLFGESEGKDGKGIFPASVNLTADLHSMGQMIQDGERNIFETIINVAETCNDICIPAFEDDFDGLKYVEGKPVSLLNEAAMDGTRIAHLSNDVPQIRITIPKRDEDSLGGLFYFLEYSCGISAYIEGVNPFNQPGVEEYKKQIKILLKK